MPGTCPACQSDRAGERFVSVRKDYSLPGYAYVTCDACGSIHLDDPKVVSQAQLTALHEAHWYDSGNFQFSAEKPVSERIDAAVAHARNLMAVLDLAPGARILDIGCGNGELVAALRRLGCEAWGIEPDARAFAVLQVDPALGERLHPLSLEALTGAGPVPAALKERFDLVILRDVLEHMFDPGQVISSIRQSLAAPGAMIYIEIPSGESLQLRFQREYAWSFMAPFHRTLFTRQGLRRLAARCEIAAVELLPDRRKNWGWTRGAAHQSDFAEAHAGLRGSQEGFRAFDYAIDDMLEEMAFALDAPPSITAVMRVEGAASDL